MARVAPPRRALGWGSGGGAICAYGDSLRFADEVLLSRGCRVHGGTVTSIRHWSLSQILVVCNVAREKVTWQPAAIYAARSPAVANSN